jgi:hypothetical protein
VGCLLRSLKEGSAILKLSAEKSQGMVMGTVVGKLVL